MTLKAFFWALFGFTLLSNLIWWPSPQLSLDVFTLAVCWSSSWLLHFCTAAKSHWGGHDADPTINQNNFSAFQPR